MHLCASILLSGQIQRPCTVKLKAPWPSAPHGASDLQHFVLVTTHRISDIGTRHRHAAMCVEPIERMGDLRAAVMGAQRLDPDHGTDDPQGFFAVTPRSARKRLSSACTMRIRISSRHPKPQEEKQRVQGSAQEHHGD